MACFKRKGKKDQTTTKMNLKSSIQTYSRTMKHKVRAFVQLGSVCEQVKALQDLYVLLEQAWSMPVHGKDYAYCLCDILRTEKALDILISNLTTTDRQLLKASARLLEQSLIPRNKKAIDRNGLEALVKFTCNYKDDTELASTITGLFESLFTNAGETLSLVIKLGGLDVIIFWCRSSDRVTLKHCAIALSNLALYGSPEDHFEMTKHKVPEWLFPLAFMDDDSIRYYACLAIAILASNKEIEACVFKSGTLSLVMPFVGSHDPQEFGQMDRSHLQGRSASWLIRLVPILTSKREEAQALAAFHMTMEASIKVAQGRKEVLYEVDAVKPLRRLVSARNSTVSRLAGQALRILGEEVHKLSQQVMSWTTKDVVHWVAQVGFDDYGEGFRSCHVDGDLLLRLTEDELIDSLKMSCAITRKRFLRELRELKISADYTSCDPTKLWDWLIEIGPEFSQYTYPMIKAGVDKHTLRSLNHDHLANNCCIDNDIHRMKILEKIEDELRNAVYSSSFPHIEFIDVDTSPKKKPIDVFLSYRRSNGSQLVSLLKVHLQLRGFTVFIDIEGLQTGKFDESLLDSVRKASNFVIVLTPNALDRCIGDVEKKDWVHREIVAALEAGVKIVPLFDNFQYPSVDQLPEDMRELTLFNGILWIHEFQDACVDKLERFLRCEGDSSHLHPQRSVSGCSLVVGTASPKTLVVPKSPACHVRQKSF